MPQRINHSLYKVYSLGLIPECFAQEGKVLKSFASLCLSGKTKKNEKIIN